MQGPAEVSAGCKAYPVAKADIPKHARDEVYDQEAAGTTQPNIRSRASEDAPAKLPHRKVPICFSTNAELVSRTRRFRRMCTTPTCSHIGTKKLRSRRGAQRRSHETRLHGREKLRAPEALMRDAAWSEAAEAARIFERACHRPGCVGGVIQAAEGKIRDFWDGAHAWCEARSEFDEHLAAWSNHVIEAGSTDERISLVLCIPRTRPEGAVATHGDVEMALPVT